MAPKFPSLARSASAATASRATAQCCPRASPCSTSYTLGRYAGDRAIAGSWKLSRQPPESPTATREVAGHTAEHPSSSVADSTPSTRSKGVPTLRRSCMLPNVHGARVSWHTREVHMRLCLLMSATNQCA
eukprot:7384618-Prymnesium_polylepis.2